MTTHRHARGALLSFHEQLPFAAMNMSFAWTKQNTINHISFPLRREQSDGCSCSADLVCLYLISHMGSTINIHSNVHIAAQVFHICLIYPTCHFLPQQHVPSQPGSSYISTGKLLLCLLGRRKVHINWGKKRMFQKGSLRILNTCPWCVPDMSDVHVLL